MLTIKDIAKLAGVSVSTVSKALNNDPLIKNATKEKVHKIAEKHGYRRNLMASQLVSGKSRIIGFILGDLSNPLFAIIAKKLDYELKERGYKMVAVVSSDSIELFSLLRVDGVILWASMIRQIDYLKELRIPCFILGTDDSPNSQHIKVDRKDVIFRALEHLIAYGHRRIGFIGDSQEVKVQGYREGLERYGIPYRNDDVLPAHSTWEDGYKAIREYPFTDQSPTAFIGLNNLITRGALRAMLDRGIRVPEDVSLIGYDNLPEMQYAEVAITTVGPSLEELASKAAEMMVSIIKDGDTNLPIVIQPTLYERNSVSICKDSRSSS